MLIQDIIAKVLSSLRVLFGVSDTSFQVTCSLDRSTCEMSFLYQAHYSLFPEKV